MDPPKVNYNRIAGTYNRRFTKPNQPNTTILLREMILKQDARRILEVGCGTAHWLYELQNSLNPEIDHERRRFFGLDLSLGMLIQACDQKPTLILVQGEAERLPFINRSFDLILCINAIHHFGDPRGFILEASRLLKQGSNLAVVGTDPHGHYDDWYVYKYFSGTYELDLARFPTQEMVNDWLVEACFESISWKLAEHIHDPKVGKDVLADPYLEKNVSSQLALLSDEAYHTGLEKIKAALASSSDDSEPPLFPTDIYLHMLTARKPEKG